MSDDIARDIIAEGQRRKISPKGIQIALATALVESNCTMYANSNLPASLNYPHTAVGSDGTSVGPFQQQDFSEWGTLDCRMNTACSAGLFYDHLVRFDYNSDVHSPGWYAQQVQRSAFPDRYDQRWTEALQLYSRLVGALPKTGIPQANINLAYAEFNKYLGDDYVYGGTGPGGNNPGFDCSGLALYILYILVKGTAAGFVRNGSTLSWVPGGGGPFGTTQVANPHSFPADAVATIAIHHEGGGEADHMNIAVTGKLMESSGSHGICTQGTGAIPQDDPYWTDWWCLRGLEGEEDDMFSDADRQFLGDIHGALFNKISSLSPFRHLGEGAVLEQHDLPINADLFLHPQWVEWSAKRGDPGNINLLNEIANGDSTKFPDRAQDIKLAQKVLANLGSPESVIITPIPAPTPTPTPTSPPPQEKAIGPSGVIAILGLLSNFAIWLLQYLVVHGNPQMAAIASGIITFLAVVGIQRAPNTSIKKSKNGSEQAPTPVVVPEQPKVPEVSVPTPISVSDLTLTQAMANVANAEAKAETVMEQIKKELGD